MPRDQTAAPAPHRQARGPGARDAEHEYLRLLGGRVRAARARRGMTRKILARDAGLSERYLGQLETGRGNASIVLLRQVARALGIPVAELVDDAGPAGIELTLLRQLLVRLPASALGRAREILLEQLGGGRSRLARVALVGLRGAGKSTLGAALAARLGSPFIELDRAIELESGMGLAEIFETYGQPAYRRHERRALEGVLERNARVVIATGGSLVSEAATYELLLASCFTVWLKASPEEHMARVVAQGDSRPMAGNDEAMADLKRILAERVDLYARADLVIDTSRKPARESLRELVEALPA